MSSVIFDEFGSNNFVIESGILTKYIGESNHVIIPNSVEAIGESAFEKCTGLTGVSIPDSADK